MKGFVQAQILIIALLLIGGVFVVSKVSKNNPEPVQSQVSVTIVPTVEQPLTPTPTAKVIQTVSKTIIKTTPTPTPIQSGPTLTPLVNTKVRLNTISPSKGKVGDVILIQGDGFGKSSFYFPDPTNFKGSVSFYGSSGQNSGGALPAEQGAGWWSNDQIKVKVPNVQAGFFYQVEVISADGERSNRLSFEVTQ